MSETIVADENINNKRKELHPVLPQSLSLPSTPYMAYFQNSKPSAWSIVNFLEWWKAQNNMTANDKVVLHSAYKTCLQNIIYNKIDEEHEQRAADLFQEHITVSFVYIPYI